MLVARERRIRLLSLLFSILSFASIAASYTPHNPQAFENAIDRIETRVKDSKKTTVMNDLDYSASKGLKRNDGPAQQNLFLSRTKGYSSFEEIFPKSYFEEKQHSNRLRDDCAAAWVEAMTAPPEKIGTENAWEGSVYKRIQEPMLEAKFGSGKTSITEHPDRKPHHKKELEKRSPMRRPSEDRPSERKTSRKPTDMGRAAREPTSFRYMEPIDQKDIKYSYEPLYDLPYRSGTRDPRKAGPASNRKPKMSDQRYRGSTRSKYEVEDWDQTSSSSDSDSDDSSSDSDFDDYKPTRSPRRKASSNAAFRQGVGLPDSSDSVSDPAHARGSKSGAHPTNLLPDRERTPYSSGRTKGQRYVETDEENAFIRRMEREEQQRKMNTERGAEEVRKANNAQREKDAKRESATGARDPDAQYSSSPKLTSAQKAAQQQADRGETAGLDMDAPWALYEILGVARTANDKQLKDARNEAAKRLHENKMRQNGASEQEIKRAGEMLAIINDAYDYLKEKDQREQYIRNGGRKAPPPPAARQPYRQDPFVNRNPARRYTQSHGFVSPEQVRTSTQRFSDRYSRPEPRRYSNRDRERDMRRRRPSRSRSRSSRDRWSRGRVGSMGGR